MRVFLAVLITALSACAGPKARLVDRVTLGDTPERIRASFGEPNRRFMRVTEGESVEVWAYTLTAPFFLMPVEKAERGVAAAAASVTGLRDDESLRLVFRAGKVVAFEGRN